MSDKKKVYVKIAGAWHEAETGHTLALLKRPALRLRCSGALVARGAEEVGSKPRDLCACCRKPPALEKIVALRAALDGGSGVAPGAAAKIGGSGGARLARVAASK